MSVLQDKAIRIINFKPKNYPVAELYKNSRNLKLTDYMKIKDTNYYSNSILQNYFLKKLEKSIDTIPHTLLKIQ